jgi:hypothetical protein
MPERLFDISPEAYGAADSILAGGLGTARFSFSVAGEFRRWRVEPSQPEVNVPAPHGRFYAWGRQGHNVAFSPLAGDAVLQQQSLFPLAWTSFNTALPVRFECCSFSPLLPGEGLERSLPLYVMVFRAQNPTGRRVETALMLTWACGWPLPIPEAAFDFQHDNLCLTGSLGAPGEVNRQGIAVPDLHYAGIYQQSIEPWAVPHDEAEIIEEFAADGELGPRVARGERQGAAAWVKFTLDAGETQEIPFIVALHTPHYENGEPRHYTQYLGRRRPDNAVVWLAEQAVQRFGAETPNYRYWMQQIEDWHRRLTPSGAGRIHALSALLETGLTWTDGGFPQFALEDRPTLESLLEESALRETWPDIARAAERVVEGS